MFWFGNKKTIYIFIQQILIWKPEPHVTETLCKFELVKLFYAFSPICLLKDYSILFDIVSLTRFRPMEFSIKLQTIKSGWSITSIEGSQVIRPEFFY